MVIWRRVPARVSLDIFSKYNSALAVTLCNSCQRDYLQGRVSWQVLAPTNWERRASANRRDDVPRASHLRVAIEESNGIPEPFTTGSKVFRVVGLCKV
jgi:hypothetical protein